MLVDGGIGFDWTRSAEGARQAELDGYDGAWAAETSHDPFTLLTMAATATETIQLGTSIAVAFARNPMTMAVQANDIHWLSKGRMVLGLGSQIKPHIEKRFSMPWSSPAARMREFVMAMHAIWDCWNNGTKLAFRGDFYTHTLMSPFFNPGPNPYGTPKVFLAGVGELMTQVAGEVCDGFLAHGFTTERYLKEITVPALETGMTKGGRSRDSFEISLPSFVATGRDNNEHNAAKAATKAQIAFYGSTPAYRGVLELHGWGEMQDRLNGLSKEGKWKEMGEALDDEVLGAFAVVGEPDHVGPELLRRYAGTVDRLSVYSPYPMADEVTRTIVHGLRS